MILQTSLEEIPGHEVLLCPVCGFYYVHPIRVSVATGEDETIIDSEGTHVLRGGRTEEAMKACSGRGVRIILEISCENGHRGKIILQFHKGITYVEYEPHHDQDLLSWRTLWRD
ncbi:MAG: hypothetical protein QXG35_10715 [Nitrososphaerota archaeon]